MAYVTKCPGCEQRLRLPEAPAGRVTHCPQCDGYFLAAPDGNREVVREACDFCGEEMWRDAQSADQPPICAACRESIEENDQDLRDEATARERQRAGCLYAVIIGATLGGLIVLGLYLQLESR